MPANIRQIDILKLARRDGARFIHTWRYDWWPEAVVGSCPVCKGKYSLVVVRRSKRFSCTSCPTDGTGAIDWLMQVRGLTHDEAALTLLVEWGAV